ncbi:MAG: hypothetical protein NTW21_35270 [Verrucomicrobia bacterium]|nr:hypothetical protein [Verrucomicrobiota bacterium]
MRRDRERLDDRRFLRLAIRRPNERGSGHFSHDGSEQGAATGYRYDQLKRPGELGELAWRMLEPILPENVRWPEETNPKDRTNLVSDWIGKIAAMNDEELAWDYLHASRNPESYGIGNIHTFLRALAYLTEHGGPETLAKVREVLLDAGAWDDLSFGEMLVRVKEFLKRSPGDASFADKLRTAVKTGLDAHEKIVGNAMGEWERKHLPETRSAWAKMLELVLQHPGKLLDKFTSIAAMGKDERGYMLQAIEAGLAKWPPAEVKAAVFQAVAVAETPEARRDLVGFLLDRYEPKGDWESDQVRYEDVPRCPPTRPHVGPCSRCCATSRRFKMIRSPAGRSPIADAHGRVCNSAKSWSARSRRRSKRPPLRGSISPSLRPSPERFPVVRSRLRHHPAE